jgi:O-antigen/teichoic acid export membrane protein
LIRTALAANFVMGLVAGMLALSASPFLVLHMFKIPPALQGQAVSAFRAVAFALPVLLVQGVLRAALSSYQRFDWINAVNGIVMSSQWLVMTLLAWRGMGVVAIIWAAVIARVVVDIVYLALLIRLVPDVLRHWSLSVGTLSRLLHFGVWVSVSQVMGPIIVYLDRMIIAALISLQAVTIYTVPTEVFSRLGILPSCIMSTLFPAFSSNTSRSTERDHLIRLYQITTRYLALILLPFFSFLIVNARDILSVWMGPHFSLHGTLVFQILAVGAFLNFLTRLPYGAVQASGRPDVTAKFHLFELPFYIALCLVLIPRWGLTGAAVACTLRVSADAFLMFWAARRYCSFHIGRPAREKHVLAIVLLLLIGLLAVNTMNQASWVRLLEGAGLLSLAYIFLWLFGIDGEDKPSLVRTLKFRRQDLLRKQGLLDSAQ